MAGTEPTIVNSVKNTITYQNGLEEQKIDQRITLTRDSELFSFATEKTSTSSSGATKIKEVKALTVEQTASGKYLIKFKSPELFASADGETIEALGLKKVRNAYVLEIDSTSPAISIINSETKTETTKRKGDELVVEIQSTDGKKYKVTAGATNISLEYGEGEDKKVFSHTPDLANGKAIAVNVDEKAVAQMLSAEYPVFETPDASNIKKFPSYLLGMYASSLENGESKTLGEFTIIKFAVTETTTTKSGKTKEKTSPYVFLTHTDADGTVSNFIYVKGKLQKCEQFLCLYDENADGSKTTHVLIQGPRKDIYYGMPLPQDETGLTAESKALLEFIADYGIDKSSGDDEIKFSTDDAEISFYKKDMRKYTDTTFRILGTSSKFTEHEPYTASEIPPISPDTPPDETGPGGTDGGSGTDDTPGGSPEEPGAPTGGATGIVPESVPEPERDRETSGEPEPHHEEAPSETHEEADAPSGEAESPATESPTPSAEATPPSEEVSDDSDKKKEDDKTKVKLDFSKTAEVGGQFGSYLGLFAMVAAVLTPFGALLAPIGLALTLTGIAATTFSDIFKLEYVKKAKKAVERLEEEEAELESFAESFLSAERDLSASVESAHEAEESFADLLATASTPAHSFMELYDEFGVGFAIDEAIERETASDSTAPFSRTAKLCDIDGYSTRLEMAMGLRRILSAKSVEDKNKLVQNFTETHFHSMPEDRREDFKKLFYVDKEPQLTEFLQSLDKLNESHEKVHKARSSQILRLAEASDLSIEEIFKSESLNATTRAKLLTDYAPTLVRRYIASDKGMAGLSQIIEAVPSAERENAIKILHSCSKRIEKKITLVREYASQHESKIEYFETASIYFKTLKKLKEHPDSFNKTEQDLEEATRIFLLENYGIAQAEEGNLQKLGDLNTTDDELGFLSWKSDTAARGINDTLLKIKSGEAGIAPLTESGDAGIAPLDEIWKEVFAKVCQHDENGKSILGEIAQELRARETSNIPKLSSPVVSYNRSLIEELKNRGEATKEIRSLVERYESAEKACIRSTASTVLDSISAIEAELGLDSTLPTKSEVPKYQKYLDKIKSDFICPYNNDVQKKRHALRIAKLQKAIDEKLASLPRNRMNPLIPHLLKAKKFVQRFADGTLTKASVNATIQKAITEIEPSLTLTALADTTHHTKRGELFTLIEETEEVYKIFRSIESKPLRDQIRSAYMKGTGEGKSVADALKEAFESTLFEMKYEENSPTIKKIIDSHTSEDGNTNIDETLAEIDQLINRFETRTDVAIESTRRDLGTALRDQVFEDAKSHHKISDKPLKYSSLIQLLSDACGGTKTTDEIRNELINLKTNHPRLSDDKIVDKVLKKLSINKKIFTDAKVGVVLTPRPIDEEIAIWEPSEKTEKLVNAVNKLKKFIEKKADSVNLEDLREFKKALRAKSVEDLLINICGQGLAGQIEGKTPNQVRKFLTTNFKLGARLDKHLEEQKYINNQKIAEGLAETKDARKRIQAETESYLLAQRTKEIETKLEALTSGAYSESTINSALVAFIDGTDQFFIDNPSITVEGSFFSAMDHGMLKKLGFTTPVLKKKLKKGKKELVSYIKQTLSGKKAALDAKLEKLKKKTSMDSNAGITMTSAVRTQMESRLSLASKTLEQSGKKHGLELRDGALRAPEATPEREPAPTAEVGEAHTGDDGRDAE